EAVEDFQRLRRSDPGSRRTHARRGRMKAARRSIAPRHRSAGRSPTALAYDRWFDEPWGRYAFAVESRALRQAASVSNARVLEAGCGSGRFASTLEEDAAAVVALDHDEGMLAVASARLVGPRLLGDLALLPLRDSSVDVTVAVTVLEFVSDPAAALRELARVTRPGGRIVLGALNPHSPWGLAHRRRLRSGTWCHARFLTRRQLRVLGSAYGRVRLSGALYAPGIVPGLRWLGPVLEAFGRLIPAFGAFQVLVIERRSL
ncbi:MAG TPA: class I SAM-dependent methyltransferase, partial [Acidimicrobiia bacterium]|nr:class I SAM-dependent methyltransferase [Acidimicrobiia bacterium]